MAKDRNGQVLKAGDRVTIEFDFEVDSTLDNAFGFNDLQIRAIDEAGNTIEPAFVLSCGSGLVTLTPPDSSYGKG